MFGMNKYETGNRQFNGVTAHMSETTRTNFKRTDADLRYKINGGGRDTYIFADNGGLSMSMHLPRAQEKSGGFLPNVNRSPDAAKKFASAYAKAKSIRYKTDGTGRDSYCTSGDGGFTNPMSVVAMDPRVAFKKSLRGYTQDSSYLDRRNKRSVRKSMQRTMT